MRGGESRERRVRCEGFLLELTVRSDMQVDADPKRAAGNSQMIHELSRLIRTEHGEPNLPPDRHLPAGLGSHVEQPPAEIPSGWIVISEKVRPDQLPAL